MNFNQIKKCKNCLMDSTASNFKIEDDKCNFCNQFLNEKKKFLKSGDLAKLIKEIKKNGKKYDCIVGLSGGIDSAYTLVKVKELGLNPLAVHMDNGWNSELSQNNIQNLISKLKVDFETYIIDWEEFKDLMISFLSANVVDIELLTDQAMFSINYKYARKYNIKHILAGTNFTSEGIKMPTNWNWFKYDKKNIKSIHKKFGKKKIKTFPYFGTNDFILNHFIRGIKWYSFLDYIDYNKILATKILQQEYDFKPYQYKHGESIFTRFYQNYILPEKFNIDKRKPHLSALIISNQLTRDEAKKQLDKPLYDDDLLKNDKNYFIKKMGWTMDDLNSYIKAKPNLHNNYPSEFNYWKKLTKFYKKINNE